VDAVMLLRRAHDAGLRIKPVGDQLLVEGPRRAEPLLRLLAAHKTEVMAALTEGDDRAGAASRECHRAVEAGYWRDLVMSEPLTANSTAVVRGLMPNVSPSAK
jgi:hypothetical protein